MTYSDATGSYQNDFLEQIPNSELRFDVPYKIDREKYEKVLKEHNQELRIFDADVVSFRADFYEHDSWGGKTSKHFTLFAWPENSPEGSKDFYDCFQFLDYKYENEEEQLKAYNEFVHAVLECVIDPDKEQVKKAIDRLNKEKETLENNINELQTILYGQRKEEVAD